MRITWCPPQSDETFTPELLKIEYQFRQAMTRLLLNRAQYKPKLNVDDILDSYEFLFDIEAKKFELAVVDPTSLKKTALSVLEDPLIQSYLKS